MDRGSWWATVHGVAESDTTEHACTYRMLDEGHGQSLLCPLLTHPSAGEMWRKEGQRGSWPQLDLKTSVLPSSAGQGKYPDVRQGEAIFGGGVWHSSYPSDICVGCCAAVPGKSGKQLARPKPHLSGIWLMGETRTSSRASRACLAPSQPFLDAPGVETTVPKTPFPVNTEIGCP